jgi:catechol 2,3-dioxygenase-like lactoylglutathione lyase family enzyme
LGSAIATGFAQGNRLAGTNYVNHVAISVANFDEAFAFYTQKMGFREAFTVRDDKGQPVLAYVQASRNTFVELQPANANRPPGLNHFGLHVENLRATSPPLKQRGVTVEEPRADEIRRWRTPQILARRIELFEFDRTAVGEGDRQLK